MSPKPWSSEACLSLKEEHREELDKAINWIFNAEETDISADIFQDKYSRFTLEESLILLSLLLRGISIKLSPTYTCLKLNGRVFLTINNEKGHVTFLGFWTCSQKAHEAHFWLQDLVMIICTYTIWVERAWFKVYFHVSFVSIENF